MERKRITPGSTNYGVASSNAGVHFQLEVNFVHHVSTVPRTQIPSLSCFLLRREFVHARPFPVLPCSALSCSDLFYSQAPTPSATWALCPCLCPHLSVCLCLSAPMPTILSESIDLLGLCASSHCAALTATSHRPIHRFPEIRASRKYASRAE